MGKILSFFFKQKKRRPRILLVFILLLDKGSNKRFTVEDYWPAYDTLINRDPTLDLTHRSMRGG